MDVLICDGLRTPIARYGGALASIRPNDLGALVLKALVARTPDADWSCLDDVIFGCANQAGEDNRNVARMSALLAGLPVGVPGVTLNRLCGSGLDAVGTAARAIRSVCDGQGRHRIQPRQCYLQHHHRLALCEPGHAHRLRPIRMPLPHGHRRATRPLQKPGCSMKR